jgi:small subunit ribosomal protein S15
VEALVIELAKDKTPPSKIGIILKDQYGIPLVKSIVGKSIKQIIEESIEIPVHNDLNNLLQKATTLRQHLNMNKAGTINNRALELIRSRIHH